MSLVGPGRHQELPTGCRAPRHARRRQRQRHARASSRTSSSTTRTSRGATPPPRATADHKLRPWVVLLVLAEGEYSLTPVPGEVAILTVKDTAPLPPVTETWAWAHVQTQRRPARRRRRRQARREGDADSRPGTVAAARPRRLDLDTRLPRIRRAGLRGRPARGPRLAGRARHDPGAAAVVGPGPAARVPRAVRLELPHRRACRLRGARAAPEGLPDRSRSVRHARSRHLRPRRRASRCPRAPRSASRVRSPPSTSTAASTYPGVARGARQRPAARGRRPLGRLPRHTAPTAAKTRSSRRRRTPASTRAWSGSQTPPRPDTRWVAELNLDPRSRAAAGLGAEIVRQRDEEYMERAWAQVERAGCRQPAPARGRSRDDHERPGLRQAHLALRHRPAAWA